MASPQDIANRVPITVALMLATLMNTLDSTIANVALPHIQGSVSAAQDEIVWVLTSYIVATAIMTPLSGWLALKIGRKQMFVWSVAGFTVASMLCGMATNLPEIVIFRLLQGIAGASLMPLSQTTLLDIWPSGRLQRVMAVWSAAVVMGPIVGPVLGGYLTESLSWRWVFYINLPVGILALFFIITFMSGSHVGGERPFDFLGFAGLALFIGGFQLVVDRGPGRDWFDSAEVWTEALLSGGGLYVFIVQSMTTRHPFFAGALLRDRNFIATVMFNMVTGILLFATSAMLPSFMQNLLGYSALQSGVASMTRGVGAFLSFIFIPFLVSRVGARPVLLLGLCLSASALWQMSRFDLSMTAGPIMVAGLVQGLGMGCLFSPLQVLAYATLPPQLRGEGAVVSTIARSLGSSAGISMIQALVIHKTEVAHTVLAAHITVTDPVVKWALPSFMSLTSPTGLRLLDLEVTRQAAMIAYDVVFSGMAVATILAAPVLLILRSPKGPVELEVLPD